MTPIPRLLSMVFLTCLSSTGGALAQSAGPDEAISPGGAVTQTFALSPAQRNAIYNAVFAHKSRGSAPEIATAIGAPVPLSSQLQDLPEPAGVGNTDVEPLKYGLAQNDVVIVDPIEMRVVDVIRGSGR